MPRLRHYKNYDPVAFDPSEFEQDDENDAAGVDAVSDPQSDTSHETPTELKGWWSNEAIITTLPDTELRSALHRYRSLAEACQQELARRIATGTHVRADKRFDIITGSHRFVDVRRTSRVYNVDARSTRRDSGKRAARQRNQVTLSPEQMLQALQMLQKLKSIKERPDETAINSSTQVFPEGDKNTQR